MSGSTFEVRSNPEFVWIPIDSGPFTVVSDTTDSAGKRTAVVTNGTVTYTLTMSPPVANP